MRSGHLQHAGGVCQMGSPTRKEMAIICTLRASTESACAYLFAAGNWAPGTPKPEWLPADMPA